MNGTSNDGPQTEPEQDRSQRLAHLASLSEFEELGAALRAGDEISRMFLDNDDASDVEGYMQPGLWLERVGLAWIATKTDPGSEASKCPFDCHHAHEQMAISKVDSVNCPDCGEVAHIHAFDGQGSLICPRPEEPRHDETEAVR